MTTQILTNNPAGAEAAPDGSNVGNPANDAMLSRIASELFARVPGASEVASQLASQILPNLSGTGLPTPSLGGAAPSFANLPASPQSAPVLESISGGGHEPVAPAHSPVANGVTQPGVAQGVPAGYAAALPLVSSIAPSRPTAGGAPANVPTVSGAQPTGQFYFLDERGANSSTGGGAKDDHLDGLAQQGLNGSDDRVVAQSFGLPGQDQLKQLLAGLYPVQAASSDSAPQSKPSAPDYYFAQHEQTYWDTSPATTAKKETGYANAGFDVNLVRKDFPILAERVNGKQLVWFDNAATTHKPQSVIDRISYFYQHENSNIHRAAHELAARATDAYEAARNKVTKFLGAASSDEIIFVRGATEAINLVANTFGKKFVGAGDEIIVSNLEHHANIVPWQQLAAEKGAKIRVIPVDDSGQILLDEYRKLITPRTKLVSVTQVSNALGTVTPIQEIIAIAHAAGVRVLVDGAQAVSHMRVNVQALDADFYVFSGHKVFGPTGIGVVYGKKELLEQLPPWQGGGNMIVDVTFERTQYHPAPMRFEAGTGNIADAVGLGAAIDYVERIGMENIAAYEHALLEYATHGLKSIAGVRLIGTAHEKASVASFVLAGYKTEEVGKALNDQEGIAVRSGHHCAQPILRRFGVEATVRPSFAFYNTCEEIDRMISVVRRLAAARR
jgi:cysteine desulfurase / selenocysteine lyase